MISSERENRSMPSAQLAQSAHNTEKRNRDRQREQEGEGISCGEAEHILCKVLAVTRIKKKTVATHNCSVTTNSTMSYETKGHLLTHDETVR